MPDADNQDTQGAAIRKTSGEISVPLQVNKFAANTYEVRPKAD